MYIIIYTCASQAVIKEVLAAQAELLAAQAEDAEYAALVAGSLRQSPTVQNSDADEEEPSSRDREGIEEEESGRGGLTSVGTESGSVSSSGSIKVQGPLQQPLLDLMSRYQGAAPQLQQQQQQQQQREAQYRQAAMSRGIQGEERRDASGQGVDSGRGKEGGDDDEDLQKALAIASAMAKRKGSLKRAAAAVKGGGVDIGASTSVGSSAAEKKSKKVYSLMKKALQPLASHVIARS